MTKRAWKRAGQLASRLMHVGVTETTGVNPDQNLSWPRFGGRHLLDFPARVDGRNDCRFHQPISLSRLNWMSLGPATANQR